MARKKLKKSITGQLATTVRRLRSLSALELAALSLYPGQENVLLAIEKENGITLRDLAERLDVRPPTVTKTIARLSQQELVEKRPAPDNARQSQVFLTKAGEALVESALATQVMVEKTALKGIGQKDRKALRKLLKRINANLERAEEA